MQLYCVHFINYDMHRDPFHKDQMTILLVVSGNNHLILLTITCSNYCQMIESIVQMK